MNGGDQVALVTGATSGLGRQTALRLARRGWRVVVHGRDSGRVDRVLREVRREAADGRGEGLVADLSRTDAVHALADRALALPRLDLLVNNAGVATPNSSPRTRRVTDDGLQLEWQVNFLAAFALTLRLTPALHSAGGRVVNVSSVAQGWGRLHWDDLQLEQRFDRMTAYAQSKLALTTFTAAYARRMGGRGVTAVSLHPGMCATKMVRSTFIIAPHRAGYGAENIVRLAEREDAERINGAYFHEKRAVDPNPVSADPAVQRRLWTVGLRQSGVEDRPGGLPEDLFVA
ncbi:SDR family NAD(P)-dependent oxidoreductase [Streptomyces triticirhizae]|uniref:SDR family NAD(P)-dependent oxidoreductase n=1 Tax=Streptomyces triticirhizae TaxID=2483353 RepID=A0A3M2LUH5_9ACTN|nr:SDR family NAD(P)-dependent oxidoreductase [Streptomyces triticirhizae]RMI41134.1 SDR family NAD(P)-dependent oxidoreductase [Streptomyces triticirhizae]